MPLTEQQTAIIKATVPILETGGETLTTHFYQTMLKEYPVVVPFFNKAHQSSGDQPRALANAVLMYARNIERLEKMGPLVNQIINKHVALNINLEHYSVVGTCLLRAIREVLGAEVATDDVIDAWAAAYGQLSAILIGAEQSIYDAKAAAPGGWRGDREFIVKERVTESTEIVSFHLYPADGQAVLAYEAGQYIGMHLFVDGDEVRRNYSLSCASNGVFYRISVKHQLGGVVSAYLHNKAVIGTVINLFPPAGDFKLTVPSVVAGEEMKPLVLIAGGVGVTPIIAMLEETLRNDATKKRPIYFIHQARNHEVQPFVQYIHDLADKHGNLRHFTCFSHEVINSRVNFKSNCHLNEEKLQEFLPTTRDVDAYFLGPKSFMSSVKKALSNLGVPSEQVHWEFFGPSASLD